MFIKAGQVSKQNYNYLLNILLLTNCKHNFYNFILNADKKKPQL